MTIRLVAFDLDGTLIRGRNSLAVIGAGLGRPEWEKQMEILYMRDETPEEMRRRVAPWSEIALATPRCSGPPDTPFTLGLRTRKGLRAFSTIRTGISRPWRERSSACDVVKGRSVELWPLE